MSKFQNCRPKKFHFHTFQIWRDDTYLNVMYISTKKASIKNVDDFAYNPDIIAYLQFHTDDETDEARVTSVRVTKKYRRRGYAYFLFLKMILYLRGVKIETVTLDDDSDNYRKLNNLYTLLGFEYLASAGPEMFVEVDTLMCVANFEHFFKRWAKFYNCKD